MARKRKNPIKVFPVIEDGDSIYFSGGVKRHLTHAEESQLYQLLLTRHFRRMSRQFTHDELFPRLEAPRRAGKSWVRELLVMNEERLRHDPRPPITVIIDEKFIGRSTWENKEWLENMTKDLGAKID